MRNTSWIEQEFIEFLELEAVFMVDREEEEDAEQRKEEREREALGGSLEEQEEEKGVRQNYKNAPHPLFFVLFFLSQAV